jgi:hypothetical protein
MNISAPRVDSLISSLDSSQEQYAGQPQEDGNNTWLARAYDRFIKKHGDDLEVVGIAGCGAVPSALVFALAAEHGPFWMITTTACSIGFYAAAMTGVISFRDKIAERDQRIAEISESKLYQLCEARKDTCEALQDENTQLEHDKAWLLCERGGLLRRLKAAETEAAAGELSRSDNKEASAAVFEFPDPKGAA